MSRVRDRYTLPLLLAFVLVIPVSAADTEPGWTEGSVTTPDGVEIHFVEAGPSEGAVGPALLFVPGWTMPGRIFEPQIEHFSAHHRVVAMDPRSQGLSGHPDDGHYPESRGRDVKAVIDSLELAPVVPVCWSMAVAECVEVVRQFGTDDLAALVLVDGLAGGEYDPQWTPFMINWVGNLQRNRRQGTESFVRSMYRTPQSEEYLARVTEWSLQTPTDAMVALMIGALNHDARDTLPKIDRPILFTVSQSPFTPRYEAMRDVMPDVRYEVFEAGHALFLDQPERFNGMLEELLAGLGDDAEADAGDGTGDGAEAGGGGGVAP